MDAIHPHRKQWGILSCFREALWQPAIQLGHLKNTPADRLNFFAAIAHALRVAKHNACGLLRTVVEQRLWHFLSQADEYTATQRLRRATNEREAKEAQRMHLNPFLMMPADSSGEVNQQSFALSPDALIVQTVTADLKRAGVTRDVFRTVQRHGYLRDWDQARWLKAEEELAQARLLQARWRYQAMGLTRMHEVMGEDIDEDEPPDEGVGSV
jgi:hypothetical protein